MGLPRCLLLSCFVTLFLLAACWSPSGAAGGWRWTDLELERLGDVDGHDGAAVVADGDDAAAGGAASDAALLAAPLCPSASSARVVVPAAEARRGTPSRRTVARAVSALRRCGVCVLEGAMGSTAAAAAAAVPNPAVTALQDAVAAEFAPLRASRARVREAVRAAWEEAAAEGERGPANKGRPGSSKGGLPARVAASVFESVADEAVLGAGRVYRERNDARVDLTLPLEAPFTGASAAANAFASPVLRAVLGAEAQLKGVQAVVALPEAEGNADQHWHRDTGLLFEPDGVFDSGGVDVHDRDRGVHLPPFAVNMFIPLVDITAANGGTEFTLGSHMWGSDWSVDENNGTVVDAILDVPLGSVLLFDYRTVHRGTRNASPEDRPVIMNVYTRPWYTDAVNYGPANLGGSGASKQSWRTAANPSLARFLRGLEPRREFDEAVAAAVRRAVADERKRVAALNNDGTAASAGASADAEDEFAEEERQERRQVFNHLQRLWTLSFDAEKKAAE